MISLNSNYIKRLKELDNLEFHSSTNVDSKICYLSDKSRYILYEDITRIDFTSLYANIQVGLFNEGLIGIGGYIIANGNPVYELIELFYNGIRSSRYIELFNDYDIVRGNSIVLDRLNSFLKDIGKDNFIVDEVKGYDIIY